MTKRLKPIDGVNCAISTMIVRLSNQITLMPALGLYYSEGCPTLADGLNNTIKRAQKAG
jgi:hypothetical protein